MNNFLPAKEFADNFFTFQRVLASVRCEEVNGAHAKFRALFNDEIAVLGFDKPDEEMQARRRGRSLALVKFYLSVTSTITRKLAAIDLRVMEVKYLNLVAFLKAEDMAKMVGLVLIQDEL